MSTFVLQLPNSFIDIDRDEMSYVDGGMTLEKTWYGYYGTFNKSECSDLSNLLWMGTGVAGIAGAISAYYTFGAGALAGGIAAGVGAIGAGYLGIAANHNGVVFRMSGNQFIFGGIIW